MRFALKSKKAGWRVLLAFGLLCCLCGHAVAADKTQQSGQTAAEPKLIWNSGTTLVMALQDRPGTMPLTLFSGPASAEERAGYFPGGEAPGSISAFFIQAGDTHILVDAGYGDAMPPLPGGLVDLMTKGTLPAQRLDYVFLTHLHPDHIGALLHDGKRAFPKAKLLVSKPELDYWLAEAKNNSENANAAKVKAIVEAYGADVLPPFAFNDTLPGGITALDASGHTPGHTVFRLDSNGKSLLILGDLVHAAALQFPLPDECAQYDMDTTKAVESRKRILTMAAEQNIPVAGMHIPFPGSGKVTVSGKGFALTPAK